MSEMDPSINLGDRIRKIRLDKKLTLSQTAEITGVSKAMLGQIERGESVPTISTLWKITTGLKISFSEALTTASNISEVININKIVPRENTDSKMKLYDVFPFDANTGFECFYIVMEPGAVSISEPHRSQSDEYIIVTEGQLHLKIGDELKVLTAPAAIAFAADVEHEYSNQSPQTVVFQNIVRYK